MVLRAVQMFGGAVGSTMLAVAIGTLVSGVSEAAVDPLTQRMIARNDGVIFKLIKAVLACSVMIILAFGVCWVSGVGWSNVWTFISPPHAAAAMQGAHLLDDDD